MVHQHFMLVPGVHRGRERHARPRATPRPPACSTGGRPAATCARSPALRAARSTPTRWSRTCRSACSSGSRSSRRCSGTRTCSSSTSRPRCSPRRRPTSCSRVMRAAAATGGTSIVFITHKLKEVQAIADRITVIRRGRSSATASPGRHRGRARRADGRPERPADGGSKAAATPGEVVLDVEDLTVVDDDRRASCVDDVSLRRPRGRDPRHRRRAGQRADRAVEALIGLRPARVRARSALDGARPHRRTPAASVLRAGVGYVPEDRQRRRPGRRLLRRREPGPGRATTGRRSPRASPCDLERDRRNAAERVEEFDVRTPSRDAPAGTLSGGNQQKVIAGPGAVPAAASCCVAGQPTRGLDVGSIEFVHRRIVQRAGPRRRRAAWSPPSSTRCSRWPTGSR